MADLRFNDNGTISLTIGADTFTLRRPTIGRLFHYRERISEISDEARTRLEVIIAELSELDDDDERAVEIRDEMGNHRRGFEWLVVPWLREVFDELGSAPLPENLDDAPAELTDMKLPTQIINFWRTVPLAHSRNGGR